MLILQGETKSMSLKNRDIMGASLKAVVSAAAAHEVDWSKALLSVVLQRGGQNETIFKDNLSGALLDSHYDNAGWLNATGVNGISIGGNQVLISTEFDMEKVYNLRHDDVMTFEITLLNGFFKGTTLDINTCRLEFDEIDGIGLEYVTGYITTKNVPAGESRFTLTAGDNVESITLIDTAVKVNFDPANCAIQNVSLNSDKLSYNKSLNGLLAARIPQFASDLDAETRGNCFRLHSGVELDAVKIDLTLDPAKVTSGRYMLVIRHFETSEEQLEAAYIRSQNHLAKAASKVN